MYIYIYTHTYTHMYIYIYIIQYNTCMTIIIIILIIVVVVVVVEIIIIIVIIVIARLAWHGRGTTPPSEHSERLTPRRPKIQNPELLHTCHILPPSEIDLGLWLPVFAGSGGKHLFHRIGWKGRIWQLCPKP